MENQYVDTVVYFLASVFFFALINILLGPKYLDFIDIN